MVTEPSGSDPTYTAICDGCGDVAARSTVMTDALHTVSVLGWKWASYGRLLCSRCAEAERKQLEKMKRDAVAAAEGAR